MKSRKQSADGADAAETHPLSADIMSTAAAEPSEINDENENTAAEFSYRCEGGRYAHQQIRTPMPVTGIAVLGKQIYLTCNCKSSKNTDIFLFVPPYDSEKKHLTLDRVDVSDIIGWSQINAVCIADLEGCCIWQLQESGKPSQWLPNNYYKDAIRPYSLSEWSEGLAVATDHKVLMFLQDGRELSFVEIRPEFDPFYTLMSPTGIIFTCLRSGQKRGSQNTGSIRVFDGPFHATFDDVGECIYYEYGTNSVTFPSGDGDRELVELIDKEPTRSKARTRLRYMHAADTLVLSRDNAVRIIAMSVFCVYTVQTTHGFYQTGREPRTLTT